MIADKKRFKHYRPSGRLPICLTPDERDARDKNGFMQWAKLKQTTNIGDVDCPHCLRCIKHHVDDALKGLHDD